MCGTNEENVLISKNTNNIIIIRVFIEIRARKSIVVAVETKLMIGRLLLQLDFSIIPIEMIENLTFTNNTTDL